MPRSLLTAQHDGSATTLGFCVVCASLLEWPVLLRCGHSFCAACAERWLAVDSRCPSCGGEATFVRRRNARKTRPVAPNRLHDDREDAEPFPPLCGPILAQMATPTERRWEARFAQHPIVRELRATVARANPTALCTEATRRRWENFAATLDAAAFRQQAHGDEGHGTSLRRRPASSCCLLDATKQNRHAMGSTTTKQPAWSAERLERELDAVDERHAQKGTSGSLKHACDEYACLLLAQGENPAGNAGRYPRYLSHLGKRLSNAADSDPLYFTFRSELFEKGAAERAFAVLNRRAEVTIHGCPSSQRANRRCSMLHGIAKYVSLARAAGRVPADAGDAAETFRQLAEQQVR